MLTSLARRLVPTWDQLDAQTQSAIKTDIVGTANALVFAIVGVVWLVRATDLKIWREHGLLLVVLAVFVVVLDEFLDFSALLSSEHSGLTATSSLSPVIVGSVMFLFGPSALWITLPQILVQWARALSQSSHPALQSLGVRNFIQAIASNTFASLCGLAAYQALGGTFPITNLDIRSIALAAIALGVEYAMIVPIGGIFMWHTLRHLLPLTQVANVWQVVHNLMTFLALGRLIAFFGVLGSVLYVRIGIGSYVFGAVAVTAAALMAHRLSRAITASAFREDTYRKLESLGRTMLGAAPDVALLPQILQRDAQNLFTGARVDARLFPDTQLVRDSDDGSWPPVPDKVWQQLQDARTHFTLDGLPVLGDRRVRRQALVVPIVDTENANVIGGVYIMRNVQHGPIIDQLQTAQAFAEQIASAVLRVRAHEQQLATQMAERELVVAGEIQSRFLPKTLPQVPGYQIAAHLDPARQASGDFYDMAALPDGALTVTIADVADKGTGAALFMALTCTLVRTYAPQFPHEPQRVLQAVNRRICEDTETDLFVTVLHGVLHPATGEFRYCNAGHTPGLLLRADGAWRDLANDGMPLGIFEETEMHANCVALNAGDVLVLYTDGVTDAQLATGELFGETRMRQTIEAHAREGASVIQHAILDAAKTWAGDQPQFDDIALVVIKRM
jgi:serine phosphatase RsbU (regulator of sigma subunit)